MIEERPMHFRGCRRASLSCLDQAGGWRWACAARTPPGNIRQIEVATRLARGVLQWLSRASLSRDRPVQEAGDPWKRQETNTEVGRRGIAWAEVRVSGLDHVEQGKAQAMPSVKSARSVERKVEVRRDKLPLALTVAGGRGAGEVGVDVVVVDVDVDVGVGCCDGRLVEISYLRVKAQPLHCPPLANTVPSNTRLHIFRPTQNDAHGESD